ncbi:hypothetical protein [Kibdelosporangium aridum]|uniref:hypothetical protein n=1 Tax=Kibdelosporangium aridum TaxID=2030 RepID=UPI000F76925F|nr:hypothetical protein [Kibdelosporangium aridum]
MTSTRRGWNWLALWKPPARLPHTYALCDPRLLLPIPDGLSFADAAAFPVGLATEHDALVTLAGFTAGDMC